MKEMVPFYKKLQLIKCHLLKHSSDPEVRLIYEARAKFEHQCTLSKDPVKRGQWRPTQALEPLINEAKHASKFLQNTRSKSDTRGLGCGNNLLKKRGCAIAENVLLSLAYSKGLLKKVASITASK